MEMKINKIVLLKVIALLLCVYIAIVPFYQPKKVQASPVLACAAVFAGFISGMAALGYIHYSSLTSEQMEELNNKATANLKEAYPNATDYDNQVNIIYNLENDLLAGKDVDWSKYSGKAIYAISKAVIDVLYPTQKEAVLTDNEYFFSYYYDGYITWKPGRNWIVSKKPSWPYRCVGRNYATGQSFDSLGIGERKITIR